MHPLIQQHSREIATLCRHSHVRRLDVSGSASRREGFDPRHSDVDFLVEFDPTRITPTLSTFFDLREKLAALIGRPVDLVMAGSIRNPYIQADIERSRENGLCVVSRGHGIGAKRVLTGSVPAQLRTVSLLLKRRMDRERRATGSTGRETV